MNAAAIVVLLGLSLAGFVAVRRRRRKAVPREPGRTVIAANVAASRRK